MTKHEELCTKCGECCKWILMYIPMPTAEAKEWLEARGWEIVSILDSFVGVKAYFPCPHLTKNNRCDLGDKRPIVCKRYDGRKDKHIKCRWH